MPGPLGFRVCARFTGSRRRLLNAGGGDVVEDPILPVQRGPAPGQILPPPHRDVAVRRVNLHRQTLPSGHLGGDQRRSATGKRFVDRIAGCAVVQDRTAHAFDRLGRGDQIDRLETRKLLFLPGEQLQQVSAWERFRRGNA